MKQFIKRILGTKISYFISNFLFLIKRFFKMIFYAAITIFVKINNRKIVFNNFNGKGYGDNPKYLAEYILKTNADVELIWVCDEKYKHTLPFGVTFVKYGSFKSVLAFCSSRVWISNCRLFYGKIKKRKQIYVQLWHGTFPLKKIERDAIKDLPFPYVKNAKFDSKITNLIISNSKYKSELIKRSFWYDGEILESGIPRLEIFYDKSEIKKIYKKVREEIHISENSKILLYAPTFRDCSHNYFDKKLLLFMEALKQNDKSEWVFLFRNHPNIKKKVELPDCVKDVSDYPDMQNLLCASDFLLTDYSGSMFDVMEIERPVFLYCPDFENYNRGFTINFNELPFPFCKTIDELIYNINTFSEDKYRFEIEKFKKKLGIYSSENASKIIFNRILKEIK